MIFYYNIYKYNVYKHINDQSSDHELGSLARLGSKATKVRERGKAKLQKWVNIYF